jgi:DMSO/TMAO reductase YedYZ molybdopterin-dependent catalytic subunit
MQYHTSMKPRSIDWGLALGVGTAFATGLWTLVSGRAERWWVFALHGAAGYVVALLLLPKLGRVWRRALPNRRHGWQAWFGWLATLLSLLALASGIAWVAGGTLVVAGYNLLNWHLVFGYLLAFVVSLHMLVRAKPLRRQDIAQRRQFLQMGGMLAAAVAAWPIQQWLVHALRLPGAQRRFTGSRELASFRANAFPTVSWMADNPRPLDLASWRLSVSGLVERPLALELAALHQHDELEATLDCTGGFYTTQHWRGVLVGTLLDQAGVQATTNWVRFVSVTGYRWSLPLAQARQALLATHVGGESLSHGHGAPLRLVAPGERGLVWVKWLVAIEARAEADPGQLLAINLSGLNPPQDR